jgi:glycosyltransferase involved in cell wall biosynthesis
MTFVPLYINGRFAAQKLSGVQRFALEMTAALVRAYGDRVHILMPPDATLEIDGAYVVGRRTGQVWEQLELPRYAGQGILINLGNTGPVLARRQVVVIHDAGVFSTPAVYSWKFRLWYKTLQYLLVKRDARIVTVSEFSRRELVEHLPVSATDVAVIPEGADHMLRLSADAEVLREYGLRPGQFVVAVGTLAAHKNLSSLGRLADRLEERGMVLAIAGSIGAAAFRNSSEAQLPVSALYLGRVSDEALKALYGSAACYVIPSYYEGFGLPAMEAMTCGCVVAASDIPALRETCGDAAAYFDPASPQDIAETVLALIDMPDRLSGLRARALERGRTLTWSKAARALCDIIDSG